MNTDYAYFTDANNDLVRVEVPEDMNLWDAIEEYDRVHGTDLYNTFDVGDFVECSSECRRAGISYDW